MVPCATVVRPSIQESDNGEGKVGGIGLDAMGRVTVPSRCIGDYIQAAG